MGSTVAYGAPRDDDLSSAVRRALYAPLRQRKPSCQKDAKEDPPQDQASEEGSSSRLSALAWRTREMLVDSHGY